MQTAHRYWPLPFSRLECHPQGPQCLWPLSQTPPPIHSWLRSGVATVNHVDHANVYQVCTTGEINFSGIKLIR